MMHKRFAIVLLPVCLMLSLQALSQDGLTGKDLLQRCEYAVQSLAGQSGLSKEVHLEATWCAGYVRGFSGSHATRSLSSRMYCHQKSTTLRSAIFAVVKYLHAHPAQLDESADRLMIKALRDQYPCVN